MKVDSLKELKKLIQLCQQTGVRNIEVDGIKMELGAPPSKDSRKPIVDDPMANLQVPQPNIFDPIAMAKAEAAKKMKEIQDFIETPDDPTEEQLLNYSVRPEIGHEQ